MAESVLNNWLAMGRFFMSYVSHFLYVMVFGMLATTLCGAALHTRHNDVATVEADEKTVASLVDIAASAIARGISGDVTPKSSWGYLRINLRLNEVPLYVCEKICQAYRHNSAWSGTPRVICERKLYLPILEVPAAEGRPRTHVGDLDFHSMKISVDGRIVIIHARNVVKRAEYDVFFIADNRKVHPRIRTFIQEAKGPAAYVNHFMAADNKYLVIGRGPGIISVVDLAKLVEKHRLCDIALGNPYVYEYSAGRHKNAIFAYSHGHVRLWDIATGRPLKRGEDYDRMIQRDPQNMPAFDSPCGLLASGKIAVPMMSLVGGSSKVFTIDPLNDTVDLLPPCQHSLVVPHTRDRWNYGTVDDGQYLAGFATTPGSPRVLCIREVSTDLARHMRLANAASVEFSGPYVLVNCFKELFPASKGRVRDTTVHVVSPLTGCNLFDVEKKNLVAVSAGGQCIATYDKNTNTLSVWCELLLEKMTATSMRRRYQEMS